MKFIKTKINGVYVILPEPQEDARGKFARLFCKSELADIGVFFEVAQINNSSSKIRGTLRGLHFQKEPKAEDKIVRCVRGEIYDVAVDLRENSLTYGTWVSEELSEDNKKMLLIPKGCAHGFQTLTDNAEVTYLMSELYSPEHVSGIKWDDPTLNIPWPVKDPTLSERDKNLPFIINGFVQN